MATEKKIFDITLRSVRDGVIATEKEGNVMLMNTAAERLTGWKQKEARGKPLAEIFKVLDETTRDIKTNLVDKVLASGQMTALENHTVLVGRTGRERIIENIATPIHNDHGEIISIVLVIRDVTESQKFEGERFRESKLESVGFLAGGIAHDFNNLLTEIMGNISLAKMEWNSKDELIKRLSEAEKACELAKNLTSQLLTFSKGGAPIKKAVCVAELIKKSANFVVHGSNVKCRFEFPNELFSVEVDEGQMNQVITNLTTNAIEAMPEGGDIDIRGENVAVSKKDELTLNAGNYVKISIKDEGEGIAKKNLDKIFDPYFTTRRRGHQKGQGLGLATSYSIIKRHGGMITVDSKQSEGATFHIYLPASQERTRTQKAKPNKVRRSAGRILVMDDEQIIRDLSANCLDRMGFKVTTASDGNEAIDLYKKAERKKQPFDAVIMDLTVPGGLGGKDTIHKLRQHDPNVKAVVSSGYSHDPVMANYKKFGFKAVITKPFQIHDLGEVLKKLIN